VKEANSLAETEGQKTPNLLKLQENPVDEGARRSCSKLKQCNDSDGRSPSQFTGLATATAATGSSQSSKRRKERNTESLDDRLAAKIKREQLGLKTFGEGGEGYPEFLEEVRCISQFLAFPFDEADPTVPWDFCTTLQDKWEEFENRLRAGDMEPSAFCSKVIDACLKKYFNWPPTFGKHRNRLRQAEKTGQIQLWAKKDSDGLERRISVDEESLDWN
jgi:hypothetical protein